MIETDAPYLSPLTTTEQPQLIERRRNEPWTLGITANELANAMDVDLVTLKEATTANAKRFFKLVEENQ